MSTLFPEACQSINLGQIWYSNIRTSRAIGYCPNSNGRYDNLFECQSIFFFISTLTSDVMDTH